MSKGFEIPNHTQTPNSLFASLPKIKSVSELKVILVIIRRTFGWHKLLDKISISQLESDTGLSRESVVQGIKLALEHEFITKEAEGQSFVYGLKLVKEPDQSSIPTSRESRPELVKEVDTQKKEKEKRNIAPVGERIFRDITGRYPSKAVRGVVGEFLTEENEKFARRCWREWTIRGYSPENLHWLTEWCINEEIPPITTRYSSSNNSNGHKPSKTKVSDPEVQAQRKKEWYAGQPFTK